MFSSITGGCSEGLGVFFLFIFLKTKKNKKKHSRSESNPGFQSAREMLTPINILNILYIFCTCTNIILVLAFITRGCSEGLGVF